MGWIISNYDLQLSKYSNYILFIYCIIENLVHSIIFLEDV